ncbi:hypothetical protein [Ralstonia mannitolilytica]|uniref:hypothetical protein n=1 Tax=Ralstonia mannitolilytica TaxID=105219 RepID=UPI0026EFDABE|nr:hypothetical protein [Ralstonia mannitolilytica]
MTQLQEKAIARASDHENLVGELVEALSDMNHALWASPSCQAPLIARCKCVMCASKRARALIQRAKAEAQQ